MLLSTKAGSAVTQASQPLKAPEMRCKVTSARAFSWGAILSFFKRPGIQMSGPFAQGPHTTLENKENPRV